MRDLEQLKRTRAALQMVALDGSPVPHQVREVARMMVHTLSWAMEDGAGFRELGAKDSAPMNPYYVLAGCCCIKPTLASENETPESFAFYCSLGVGMCLCPAAITPREAPAVPDLSAEPPAPTSAT